MLQREQWRLSKTFVLEEGQGNHVGCLRSDGEHVGLGVLSGSCFLLKMNTEITGILVCLSKMKIRILKKFLLSPC